jgi:hypothetical protein
MTKGWRARPFTPSGTSSFEKARKKKSATRSENRRSRPGQRRVLFMREGQEQATSASLDSLLKHLFGFERAERLAPTSQVTDLFGVGEIECARERGLEVGFKEEHVPP